MNKADNFISKTKADNTYKPLFHFAPPVGWINDPNGFCCYDGEYHLFYQYNPFSSKWGRMHWGHTKSKDFVKWEHLPVALSPNSKNDNFLGCFSGSAIEKNGKLYLMYTGFPFLKQHQCLAESTDGINFQKLSKPVIPSKNRPPKCGVISFRDPKIFVTEGVYYAVIGAALKKGRQIALYSSTDLKDWTFKGNLIKEENKTNGIFECPDLIRFQESDVLIYSVMYTETKGTEYQNIHSSVYVAGKLNLENSDFIPYCKPKELDYGCDYYAPQTMHTFDGRTVIIAWMQMWLRSNPVSYLKHKWSGMMTLPKELYIENGVLKQKPVREIYDYFEKDKFKFNGFIKEDISVDGISGKCYLLKFSTQEASDFCIRLRKGKDCESVISYNDGILTFNREQSGHKIKGTKLDGNCNIRYCNIGNGAPLALEIFVDISSIEIIVNNEYCMSNTVYPFDDSSGIVFSSQKGIHAEISFSPFIAKD